MSNVELVDRLSRRRARMLPVLAMLFLWQQLVYFANYADDGTRLVDQVKIAAWLLLSVVLLLALTTNGFWFRSRAVRELLNDEGTRFNRAEALRVGFIAAMVAAIVIYCAAFFEPMSARVAVHVIMTSGIAVALLRFGILERRALKDG